jgi:hypothetical protein
MKALSILLLASVCAFGQKSEPVEPRWMKVGNTPLTQAQVKFSEQFNGWYPVCPHGYYTDIVLPRIEDVHCSTIKSRWNSKAIPPDEEMHVVTEKEWQALKSCPEVNVDKMSPFSTMLTKPNKDTVTLSGTTSLGTTVPIRPPLKPCDKKYEYSAVSADSKGYIEVCAPIMHEVTEKDWQALMERLKKLEDDTRSPSTLQCNGTTYLCGGKLYTAKPWAGKE